MIGVVGAVTYAPVHARLAAVATGRTAAAPPIPHIRTWGLSDPLMANTTAMSSRASLVLPLRTSARLSYNVAASLPRRRFIFGVSEAEVPLFLRRSSKRPSSFPIQVLIKRG